MDALENIFEKTNLLQKLVGWDRQTPSRERTYPGRVALTQIRKVPCFAAELWILLSEFVGQKTSDILEALSGTVKTWGRIKRFSFTARFDAIWKTGPVDVIF